MIDGLQSRALDVRSDPRGDLFKLLTRDSPEFRGFSEAYVSKVAPHSIKAWRLHKEVTSNLVLICGEALMVCKKIKGEGEMTQETEQFELDDRNPTLITVPPGVWYGFKAGSTGGVFVNLIDSLHDDEEVLRQSSNSALLGFDWERVRVGEGMK